MRPTLPVLAFLLLLTACGDGRKDEGASPGGEAGGTPPATPDPGPTQGAVDIVRVDHILIGVEGAPRMTRGDPLDKARSKAYDLLARLEAGADWDKLKAQHTDDGPPSRPPGGPYVLSDDEVRRPGITPRANMVKGFGDAAFVLEVGEIGMVDHHAEDSPFGFHILKRLPLGPDRVTVDHILVGVKGPRLPEGATPEAAQREVDELMARLAQGEDWDELKQAHSDDPVPPGASAPGGPYTMANFGQPAQPPEIFPRGGMAPAFGDVSFGLKVGEIGVADHDMRTSPFGFHIIKRIR